MLALRANIAKFRAQLRRKLDFVEEEIEVLVFLSAYISR